jgi:hypothetical protein
MDSGKILKLAELYAQANSPEYMREYMANRYHAKRDALIKELGGKCVRCGKIKDLHIDHIDQKKKTFRAADIHSIREELIRKEMDNFQLLCAECHREKGKREWDYGPKPQHGSYWMFRRYNCRCPSCVSGYKKTRREWRDKGRQKLEGPEGPA